MESRNMCQENDHFAYTSARIMDFVLFDSRMVCALVEQGKLQVLDISSLNNALCCFTRERVQGK